MNPEQVLELIDQAKRAMCYCQYALAENLIRKLHSDARSRGDRELEEDFAEALNECRRLHILGVLRSLKQVNPIQAERRDEP